MPSNCWSFKEAKSHPSLLGPCNLPMESFYKNENIMHNQLELMDKSLQWILFLGEPPEFIENSPLCVPIKSFSTATPTLHCATQIAMEDSMWWWRPASRIPVLHDWSAWWAVTASGPALWSRRGLFGLSSSAGMQSQLVVFRWQAKAMQSRGSEGGRKSPWRLPENSSYATPFLSKLNLFYRN